MYESLLCGGLFKSFGCGSSVAKAKAANVSMIMLTQSIYTAVKIEF